MSGDKRQIVKYIVASGVENNRNPGIAGSLESLSTNVNKYLAHGYQIYGNHQITEIKWSDRIYFCATQPMVKYGKCNQEHLNTQPQHTCHADKCYTDRCNNNKCHTGSCRANKYYTDSQTDNKHSVDTQHDNKYYADRRYNESYNKPYRVVWY